jgi:large subunit ribosomal protein L25
MDISTLKATPRTTLGSHAARRERERGRVPAILYGHKETPEPITLDAHDVEVALAHGARVLTLDLEGRQSQYLIKEVQHDYRSSIPVHMDLMRVAMDERVTVTVPVELRGTPKGAAEGGVLEQMLSEVEVECVVTQIPETLRVVVSNMAVNDVLFVRDLPLPPGVTIQHEPDERVATVRVLAEEAVSAEEGAEESTQPEVIGRAKAEEEEESGG